MGKIPQHIDDQLLDYLDDVLSPGERSIVEQLVAGNDLFKQRLQELKAIHHLLEGALPEEPAKNFTTSVMSRLDESPLKSGFSIMNGVFLLSGIVIAIGIGAWLLAAGVFDQARTMVDLNQIPLSQEYINYTLPALSIDGKLVINMMIILNLALALIVLDRMILKPIFQRRIHTGH